MLSANVSCAILSPQHAESLAKASSGFSSSLDYFSSNILSNVFWIGFERLLRSSHRTSNLVATEQIDPEMAAKWTTGRALSTFDTVVRVLSPRGSDRETALAGLMLSQTILQPPY